MSIRRIKKSIHKLDLYDRHIAKWIKNKKWENIKLALFIKIYESAHENK